jgi:hypothetical protein
MKKTLLIACLLTIVTLANAQDSKSKAKKSQAKEHVCNSGCSATMHMTTCGEQGHTCTKDCKKKESKAAKHGASGHTCTEACKKM